MTLTTYKWTIDRYHQAVEAGIFNDQPVELLRGELVLMSPEKPYHASSSSDVGDYLRDLLGSRAKVREGHPVTLPNNSEPEPDLAIVQPDSTRYRTRHPYPEDIFWLIEFSNTSLKKDLEAKSEVYAEAGILEYWVLNLNDRVLIVFRDPVNGTYQSKQTYTTGIISPLEFSDVSVSIDVLLDRD